MYLSGRNKIPAPSRNPTVEGPLTQDQTTRSEPNGQKVTGEATSAWTLGRSGDQERAISGSTIYAGGNFPSIKGVARKNVAGINVSDGTPTSFDPQASDPPSGGGVHALAVSGTTVYAAGFFTTIGGQTRNLIAGLKASDGTATSFNPNAAPGFGAFALAVASDGTLYAGGSFGTFDLAYQQGFAQFSPILKLVSAVSRKTHGIAGTFDIGLPQTGTPGIECRTGGASGNHQVVATFATPVTLSSASVSSGTGQSRASVSAARPSGVGTYPVYRCETHREEAFLLNAEAYRLPCVIQPKSILPGISLDTHPRNWNSAVASSLLGILQPSIPSSLPAG